MQTSSKQTLGGKRLACFTAAWIAGSSPAMTKGKNERTKEKVGGETPTDARLFCRGSGHGRAWIARRTSIGVPPRFSPQGVFHRKGRSLRPGFLGRGLSVERVLPAPACPTVQRAPRAPVVVPRGLMPKTARARGASPPAGTALARAAKECLPGRVRTGRDLKCNV